MAGGINAAIVPCINCAGRAVRDSEGLETDWYKCEECGHGFGIDWSHCGPPETPRWPLTEEEAEEARRLIALIRQKKLEGEPNNAAKADSLEPR